MAGLVLACGLAALPAQAGSYTEAGSGGTSPATITPAATSTSYSAPQGATAYSSVTPMSPDGIPTYTIQIKPGTFISTFTWVPASGQTAATDPPPACVLVEQESQTMWYVHDEWGTGTGSGTADCGLKGTTATPSTYNDPQPSQVLDATLYSVQSGSPFSVSCAPTVSFTGTTGTEGSVEGVAQVSGGASAYPITISLSGTLTDSNTSQPVLDGSGNQQILVGQGCTATVVGLPSIPGATISYAWTVPGNRVQNFVISSDQTSGTVTPFTPPNAASAHWFWSDKAAIETVSCTVSVTFPAGQGNSFTMTPTTQVSLQAPTSTVNVTSGAVQLNGTNSGTYGATYDLYLGSPDTNKGQGIAWTGHVNQPSPFSGQGPGLWHFTQLITPTRSRTKPKGVAEHSSNDGKSGLDTYDPYGSAAYFADDSHHTNGDSPGFGLDNAYSNYQVTETFQTYVMYQPPAASGGDRILVPLYEIDWNWGANVNIVNSSWANFGTNSVGGKLTVTSQQIQTQHPIWTMLITKPPAW